MALKTLIAILFYIGGCLSAMLYNQRAGEYTRYCVDGVWYLKFDTGVVAQLNRNGTPDACKVVTEEMTVIPPQAPKSKVQ